MPTTIRDIKHALKKEVDLKYEEDGTARDVKTNKKRA